MAEQPTTTEQRPLLRTIRGVVASDKGDKTIKVVVAYQTRHPKYNNESGFYIERSDDGGDTWFQVATAGVNATAYSLTGLRPGTPYSFRVRAFNSVGNSA